MWQFLIVSPARTACRWGLFFSLRPGADRTARVDCRAGAEGLRKAVQLAGENRSLAARTGDILRNNKARDRYLHFQGLEPPPAVLQHEQLESFDKILVGRKCGEEARPVPAALEAVDPVEQPAGAVNVRTTGRRHGVEDLLYLHVAGLVGADHIAVSPPNVRDIRHRLPGLREEIAAAEGAVFRRGAARIDEGVVKENVPELVGERGEDRHRRPIR